MLRKDIETMLKTAKQKTISLVLRKEDPLGMACSLQGGYLMDCWDTESTASQIFGATLNMTVKVMPIECVLQLENASLV